MKQKNRYYCFECATEMAAECYEDAMVKHARNHSATCTTAKELHNAVENMKTDLKRLKDER